MPNFVDLTSYRGTTLSAQINVSDESGLPFSVVGYSFSGWVKHKYSDTGILLDLSPFLTTGSGIGIIGLDIPHEYTETFPVTKLPYRIDIIDSDIFPVAEGNILIEP
jgi:hypothetical protein